MTEKVAKYISESDNESALFQSPEKMKENVDNPLITAGVSGDSGDEYGTASEDEESDDDYSDEDETNSDDDEDREGDENEESVTLDAERQSGDGQEQDAEAKKKVDDDEDRSNPQYIPKKGTFYEHDDRTAEDVDAEVEEIIDDDPSEVIPGTGSGGGGGPGKEKEKKDGRITKKWQASQDRWTHDRFDEGEQAPKSRSELVSSYGYDIRNEDGPPRARRRRRYGRGPSKYTRNWEDESAYTKPVATSIQKKPRPEDFPALGSEPQLHQQSQQMQQRPHNKSHRRERQSSSEYKENNDRNIERNERHQQQQQRRENFKDYKSSSSSSNRRSDRQKPDRDRRNDGDRSRGSFRQNQVSGMDNRNRSNEIPSRENQRYESRQSYEQEVNYNRSRYQGHSQQQQQVHESQIVDGYQKNNNVVERNRIPVNQRLQGQEIIQHVQHMQQQQQPPPPSQSQMMRQEMMQQQQQQQQKQTQVQMQGPPPNVALNDANRTKRYSIQRQRQGMDVPVPVQQAVPPQPPPQMVVQQQGGQITVQDHNQIEAALLQQLQSEKIKQMHSTLGHQKQISYQQTIGNQSSPQNSQMSIPTAQQQQQQYQTQAAAAAYYSQNAEYAQPGAPQNQAPAQMLAASTQNAAVAAAAAAAAAPQYPQYAYIQSQQAPPPHIQAQSFPAVPQTAPQYAAQPAYATGYQPAAAAYGNPAPQQAAAPAPAPIYQSQPPPNITHYFAQPAPAHQAPPANPPQRVTRRPTNAIPILAPPDRKEVTDVKGPDATKQNADSAAENIDHILDNMFVRRPPIQASNLMKGGSGDPNVVAESVKGLSIKDDNKDDSDKNQSTMPDQVG